MQLSTTTHFQIKHGFKDKPTTTRYYSVLGYKTFEEVLLNHLQEMCSKHFFWDFTDSIVASHFRINRIEANAVLCVYSIEYRKMHGDRKKIYHEILEIECVHNQGDVDILTQEYEFIPFREYFPEEKPEKNITKWLMDERRAIRIFLLLLDREGSLEKLRKKGYMSRATYYRNLKYCKEKGYIRDGKIVRRIMT